MKPEVAVFTVGIALLAPSVQPQTAPAVRLEQVIALPGVHGRIDHMAADLKRKRMFVAALGNNTVELLDLGAGRRIAEIRDLHEPQGLLYVPQTDKLFVAGGGDGTCRVFAGLSLQPLKEIKLGEDADNIRYDTSTREVFVGYGQGAIAILDAASYALRGDVRLDAHPESFQLEQAGRRVFVNVPGANHIAVIDRDKRAVVSKWPVTGAAANYPMALDEKDHLLFAGCRKPPLVLVYDTTSGKPVASFSISGDIDDLFYDSSLHRIYASCGEGYLDIIEQLGPANYTRTARIPASPGSRTALFIPELERLYVAVPSHAGAEAEIRVYQVLR